MTKKICKIKNCNSLVHSHGYCNKHDIQMRRHGKITDKEIKKIDGEIWKGITNFKYYKVSNKGRIKSTRCNGEKILKPVIYRKGVNPKKRIGLGSGNVFNVHTIVANTFLENKFNDKRVVFKSQDTLECSTDNIEWYGIPKENIVLFTEKVDRAIFIESFPEHRYYGILIKNAINLADNKLKECLENLKPKKNISDLVKIEVSSIDARDLHVPFVLYGRSRQAKGSISN